MENKFEDLFDRQFVRGIGKGQGSYTPRPWQSEPLNFSPISLSPNTLWAGNGASQQWKIYWVKLNSPVPAVIRVGYYTPVQTMLYENTPSVTNPPIVHYNHPGIFPVMVRPGQQAWVSTSQPTLLCVGIDWVVFARDSVTSSTTFGIYGRIPATYCTLKPNVYVSNVTTQTAAWVDWGNPIEGLQGGVNVHASANGIVNAVALYPTLQSVAGFFNSYLPPRQRTIVSGYRLEDQQQPTQFDMLLRTPSDIVIVDLP